MASDQEFVEFIVDQIERAEGVSYRKMFGEYALYAQGKVVALVCDNRLFIKPTERGRAFIEEVVEAPPYPGAKPYFLIEDRLEDREWISRLVRITAEEVPAPQPKKTAKKKTAKKKTAKKTAKKPGNKPGKNAGNKTGKNTGDGSTGA